MGDVAVWSRTVVAGWLVALGAVSAVGFVVAGLLVESQLPLFLWLLVASAALVVTGAVRVTVTDRDVTVHAVVLPLVRRRIPHARIREATAKRSRPMELGGWGYRWLPGQTSVSLRAGDALWLELTSGKFFVVTVDDAEEAAELVNGYVAQEASR